MKKKKALQALESGPPELLTKELMVSQAVHALLGFSPLQASHLKLPERKNSTHQKFHITQRSYRVELPVASPAMERLVYETGASCMRAKTIDATT